MWEWYLAAVDVGFQNGSNMVFQLLLSRQVDAALVVRGYLMRSASGADAR